MAKSKAAAENAAIEETAVVEETTAKTYTQEELDAILAEKLKKQNETIEALQEKPEFIQDNPEGEEMEIIKIPMYLGPNDDPRGEYVAVNGVAMFVHVARFAKSRKNMPTDLK